MAWQLTVAYIECGFDGPGWYVLNEGNPIWGAFDTKHDADAEKKEALRHRIGPAVRVNGHSVWIVETTHEDDDGLDGPPLWRQGCLVMVDDEDTGPYHQTVFAAQDYMKCIVEDIRRHPERWSDTPPAEPLVPTIQAGEAPTGNAPPKRMAPTTPPEQVAHAKRKRGQHG
jgi:hypothetical protein